jgi:hypothetical protein
MTPNISAMVTAAVRKAAIGKRVDSCAPAGAASLGHPGRVRVAALEEKA